MNLRKIRSGLLFLLFLTLTVGLIISSTPTSVLAQEDGFTDQEISFAIEDEFLFDPAISLNEIDVSTEEGVVTLDGTVNNILSQDRAVRLAETVKGVRSVINQVEVVPSIVRTDDEIATDVIDALAFDPATESYDVGVTVLDGAVTLTGTVQSWQEKQLVERVAKGVQGVTEVDNQLAIAYVVERTDSEIQEEIEETLRWDIYVDHALINVDVTAGEVSLTGIVGSAAEKRQATADAWTTGVETVDNTGLTVERWARDEDLRQDKYVVKSDAEIEQAIQDALLIDPRTSIFDIQVDVSNGFATLRGTVDNLRAKRAAVQDARSTVGVLTVTDRLKVRPDEIFADESIATEVRNALARDPDVNRFDINISVIDGTVYLSGVVDSFFEKGQADDVASRVQGVVDVVNNLEVNNLDSVVVFEPYVYDYYPYGFDWFDYQPYYTFTTDAEILDDVQDELWWSPFVDSDQVDVSVTNGAATLTGTVDSWAEREAAVENAYEGGATWVYNQLEVQ